MANSYDKTRKKMNILVIFDKYANNNILISLKNIICPEYSLNIKINKINNYKIDL